MEEGSGSDIDYLVTDDEQFDRVLEGRYRLLERIGRGGMSTVYRAHDERLDRQVAVKVMSAALSTDPAFADRFARAVRVAARLSHMNAVAVYDQGTADREHVFLVMELVRGRTLRDLLREQGHLSPAQAVSIMEPVLGALAAAHRAGVVHRDVKPENILLADDGVVKVADFGLARAIESDATTTRTGFMMGTVAYCPPEQISRGTADARSDVYSSGVVLFELLTGSTPFTGDSAMAVAYQHVNSDVPRPSSRRLGIPAQLDDVVLRATSREQSGRPLDAGALLAELHDVRLDLGLPVVAVPPRSRSGDNPDDTELIGRSSMAANPMPSAVISASNTTAVETETPIAAATWLEGLVQLWMGEARTQLPPARETVLKVVARTLEVWAPSVAADWLSSPNAYLQGARPVDVLNLGGADDVLEALDAAEQGVF
jgi:serine/threonine protein kinase